VAGIALDRASEVERELTRRRADLTPHARGSLERHLKGVRDVLERWGQPERVTLAGLLHSAYATEAYGHRLFGRGERGRVRELVGAEAERLVFAFCMCRRGELLAAARLHPARDVEVPSRGGGGGVALIRREVAELLVLHAANLAEQECAANGAPSAWLHTASDYLAAARGGLEVEPGLFAGALLPFSQADDAELRAVYRTLWSRHAQAGTAGNAPVGEPLLVESLRALLGRRVDDARGSALRAVALLDAWGVAWDKRLRIDRWRALATMVARDAALGDRELEAAVRRAGQAFDVARASPARLWAHLEAQGAFDGQAPAGAAPTPAYVAVRAGELPPRFAHYLAGLRTNAERPLLPFYPGLRVQPWHDAAGFPIAADLERLAPRIAEEAKQFDVGRFQDEAEDIGREGRWSVLFFLEMGRRNEENLARCPALHEVLERHRTLTTHAGLMYLSCLDPGTRVAPHRGPTNVRLRCHLGLEVPDRCGVRVGGVTGAWREGRCIVFDDSFEHEVWNESDRRRVVLVLDLWHPDLDDDEVKLLAGLHRYGAANGPAAERYWAKNDAELRRAQAASAPSEGSASEDSIESLDRGITAAMRSGDLVRAGELAARYAALCRATRWYPTAREDDPPLPASIEWAPVLTPSKLLHDIEQLEYLQRQGVRGDELSPIIAAYERLLDTLRPLGDEARVPLLGVARAQVGHVYNRLVHLRPAPRASRALSAQWNPAAAERDYLARRPNAVVLDDFLSEEALVNLRRFCMESTIWSANRYRHGRLGSFFRDGFNCPLLVQIAEELRAAFPNVIGTRHPVTQIWGYKYASEQPRLPPHADFAAVNVNFWITPDEANLEPGAGGLILYDVEAPRDWDFEAYNRDAKRIRALLTERKARATHVPYRCNRAVLFDSDLFHTTPALRFRPGYEDRRINVTVLFGDRHRA
jgi:aspartyl/asparaginyl beta-hydroxylase (cupin superfamily)